MCCFDFQLSDRTELPDNATCIFDILIQHLCVEHIDYALELGLQGLSIISLHYHLLSIALPVKAIVLITPNISHNAYHQTFLVNL